jgi:hypothetical protein
LAVVPPGAFGLTVLGLLVAPGVAVLAGPGGLLVGEVSLGMGAPGLLGLPVAFGGAALKVPPGRAALLLVPVVPDLVGLPLG